jgi:hypothetical protein
MKCIGPGALATVALDQKRPWKKKTTINTAMPRQAPGSGISRRNHGGG